MILIDDRDRIETMTKTITYRSKAYQHPTNNRNIWRYNIPPEGGKLKVGDRIEFILENCKPEKAGIFTILYEGEWRERIKSATKIIKHGYPYTDVKIWRYEDSSEYQIYFGRVSDGTYPIKETELGF